MLLWQLETDRMIKLFLYEYLVELVIIACIGVILAFLALTRRAWAIKSYPKGTCLRLETTGSPSYVQGRAGSVSVVAGRFHPTDTVQVKRVLSTAKRTTLQVRIAPGDRAGTLRVEAGHFYEGDVLAIQS